MTMVNTMFVRAGVGLAIVALAACRAPGQNHDRIKEAAQVHGEIIIAGCLQQEGDAGAFVLANAILAPTAAGRPVLNGTEAPDPMMGTPASTGTLPATLRGPSYAVQAPGELDLRAHVGRQVQVTGTLASERADERPVGTSGTDAAAATAIRGNVDGTVVAGEVRLVAHTCM